ncbi:MBL fold metallo-hydrolase [Actinomadura scrupuli]|uniref:MBL fold metallo-hydrolase n=1 Tax=Actinomadura scrupuli TaxID=559629 RepID=UPI003D97C3D8
MSAELKVLTVGYVGDRVAGTVTLLREGETVAVVDPGMVADRRLILDPLAGYGVRPDEVTDVIFSHHHPDHTLNAALFPDARYHDFMAVYKDDVWSDRDADGFALSESVRLMTTPGHTPQDISTLVDTAAGLIVLTHLWWTAEGPAEDPYAPDPAVLRASREQVLALRPALIIPGHGAPFEPGPATPR